MLADRPPGAHMRTRVRQRRSSPAMRIAAVCVVAAVAFGLYQADRLALWAGGPPASADASYDVIVVGTDPEGIAAAVSAARNGLRTLLIDGRGRNVLGGLFTLGWLNSIDLNCAPPDWGEPLLNGGIFLEWYREVGDTSFDVTKATRAFERLVAAEPRLDVVLGASSFEPILGEPRLETRSRTVRGLIVTMAVGTRRVISAPVVIDATQDADIAAACGVPYTVGREDLGEKGGDAPITLVFRLRNITDDVWRGIQAAVKEQDQGQRLYGSDDHSAWGYVAMGNYPPVNVGRVAMRGLNIGRQENGTALVNGFYIFGVDLLDPASKEEALRIGRDEIPHVVDYLKRNYPEFAQVELDGFAPELYVRETRHIRGEYRLTILDVLENRDQWDRVALGSYPVDIQRRDPTDDGVIMCRPVVYAVPFRCLVPLEVDGLLVVGRCASFDSLPHGSARVVPVGMATGQAAGAAVAIALREGVSLRQLSRLPELVVELQNRLRRQGLNLRPFTVRPQPYMEHEAYPGLQAAVSLGFWAGGYNNDFRLDEASNPHRMARHMFLVARARPAVFGGDPAGALEGLEDSEKTGPLTLRQAVYTILLASGPEASLGEALATAGRLGLLRSETLRLIDNPDRLTNGDAFLLIKDAVRLLAGESYR